MVEVKARQERACPFACSGDVVPTTREVLCLSYRKVHLVRLGRLGDVFFLCSTAVRQRAIIQCPRIDGALLRQTLHVSLRAREKEGGGVEKEAAMSGGREVRL